jgi:C-terminal processing protease CtpA/Prc
MSYELIALSTQLRIAICSLVTVLLTILTTEPACAQTASPAPPSRTTECRIDFDSAVVWVSRDYAGYLDRRRGAEKQLDDWTSSVRNAVERESNPARCTAELQRYIAVFRERDHHIELWEDLSEERSAGSAETSIPAVSGQGEIELTFADDSTAVLRIASFGQQKKGVIDSVVSANRQRLLQTPYLVIDVRGNGGGWNAAYDAIIPFIYTRPIQVDGMEGWVSQGTIDNLRRRVQSPATPEALKAQFRQLLQQMDGKAGSFIPISQNYEIRKDTVFPNPRRVAILIDRRCVSTCEQFLLDARQSGKVSILGKASTRGLLDYGNAQTRTLPSGIRKLAIPASRSLRLPANPLDAMGVAPTVRIPDNEKDPLAFALRFVATKSESAVVR